MCVCLCLLRGGGEIILSQQLRAILYESDSHPLAKLGLDVVLSKNMLVNFLRHDNHASAAERAYACTQCILEIILLCASSCAARLISGPYLRSTSKQFTIRAE